MPASSTTNSLLRDGHCTGCRRRVPAPHLCRWAVAQVHHHRLWLCTRCALQLQGLRLHPPRLAHTARRPPRRATCQRITSVDFVFIAWGSPVRQLLAAPGLAVVAAVYVVGLAAMLKAIFGG